MTELQTQAQQVLDLLRAKGWTQGHFGGPDGPLCIEGAMRWALGEYHAQPLCDALHTTLGTGHTCLTPWNDQEGRTFQDIEAILTTIITQPSQTEE